MRRISELVSVPVTVPSGANTDVATSTLRFLFSLIFVRILTWALVRSSESVVVIQLPHMGTQISLVSIR